MPSDDWLEVDGALLQLAVLLVVEGDPLCEAVVLMEGCNLEETLFRFWCADRRAPIFFLETKEKGERKEQWKREKDLTRMREDIHLAGLLA